MDRIRQALSGWSRIRFETRVIAICGIGVILVGTLGITYAVHRHRSSGPSLSQVSSQASPSPTPAPTPTPTLPPSGLQPLSVKGDQILAGSSPARLVGVNFDGSEFACFNGEGVFDGGAPGDAASVQALKSWDVSLIRLPLNEDCWLGINGMPAAYSGANYQAAIEQFVTELNQAGIYVDLDLHNVAPGTTQSTSDLPMPDLDHAPAFWTSVATAFRGNDDVLFDLYNEPTVPAWTCWLEGSSAPNANPCPSVDFAVAGMQTLVNAVRSTGSTAPILLPGLFYGNDIAQIPDYLPKDPYHQLVADAHVYGPPGSQPCSTPACFASTYTAILKGAGGHKAMPIIADETGEDYEDPTKDCSTRIVEPMYDWFDQHGIGYASWVWNAGYPSSDCMRLISSPDGTVNPDDPYAAFVHQHLVSSS
jgi:hypothetical protein